MAKEYSGTGYEIDRDMKDDIMVAIHRFNTCDSHFHQQVELVYSHSSRMKIEIDQEIVNLRRGDFLIVHSYGLHKYSSIRFSSVVCVPLKYTNIFNKLQSIGSAYTLIRRSLATNKIYRAMKKLSKYKYCNGYKKDSLFYALLAEIFDAQIEFSKQKSNNSSDISFKIIEFINEHYKENINLEILAAHCGYSKNYVSTLFNTNFKCNLNEYINLRRLQAFVELQSQDSAASITDTAEAVGFNSPRTFFNAFKEHYKMTPKNYLSLRKK